MPQVAVCGGCKRQFQNPQSCRGHQIRVGSCGITRMCQNAGIQMRWIEVAQEYDSEVEAPDEEIPIAGKSSDACGQLSEIAEQPRPNATEMHEGALKYFLGNELSIDIAFFIEDEALSIKQGDRLIEMQLKQNSDVSFTSVIALRRSIMEASIKLDMPKFISIDLKDDVEQKDSKYFRKPMILAYRNIKELILHEFAKSRAPDAFVMDSSTVPGQFDDINSGNTNPGVAHVSELKFEP